MPQSPSTSVSPSQGGTPVATQEPLAAVGQSASALATSSLASRVITATGPKANPRLAAILPSLVKHLYAFAYESGLTVAEWTAGVKFINESGRMSDDKRNETQLVCDVLGLESLVDSLAVVDGDADSASASRIPPTPTAILGPFYRSNAPEVPIDGSIVRSLGNASTRSTALVRGTVRAAGTGLPLTGDRAAVVDVWHSAPNGLYEQQDPEQPDMNLRGRVTTSRSDGRFSFYTLRPAPYAIPNDGPAGRLLELLDRQPLRPAHMHFRVSAPGYSTLVTQLFDALDENLQQDSVFAVKDSLVVAFRQLGGDPQALWVLDYDFYLTPETNMVEAVAKRV